MLLGAGRGFRGLHVPTSAVSDRTQDRYNLEGFQNKSEIGSTYEEQSLENVVKYR